MVYSIYHFFKHLVTNRHEFYGVEKLESFPFDDNMLACKNIGQFPDLAIRLNVNNPLFTGGELIELKDSKHIITKKKKNMNLKRFQNVFCKTEFKKCEIFSLKHHLDGYFTTFQVDL